MAKHITISKADGTWVVRAGGAVLAESQNALELTEDGYGPVIYFPRDDIAMDFLDVSERTSHCPHRGDASYFSIITKSTTIQDAAWSYENPNEGMREIAGHLAFNGGDQVAVEQV
ncbi:DUF427 domain-containing protein [Boseongicola aestuarii]|uniref:DUF427 domain-containing protein n=1 Tax=Boseongicola aestuarii TaxID=1470561 RepID=A0A238J3P4_9RHOB|nr:DUF427 domain-containing protein [Boseongicola aestuarii]SMX24785.1 hypothetical protein BOA8489_02914 [Boseongicola aestuarii]